MNLYYILLVLISMVSVLLLLSLWSTLASPDPYDTSEAAEDEALDRVESVRKSLERPVGVAWRWWPK